MDELPESLAHMPGRPRRERLAKMLPSAQRAPDRAWLSGAAGRVGRPPVGASTVRQALATGALDELVLDIVPVLLGSGERVFDSVSDPGLEPVTVGHSPLATHVRYRVGR